MMWVLIMAMGVLMILPQLVSMVLRLLFLVLHRICTNRTDHIGPCSRSYR